MTNDDFTLQLVAPKTPAQTLAAIGRLLDVADEIGVVGDRLRDDVELLEGQRLQARLSGGGAIASLLLLVLEQVLWWRKKVNV